jgi:hypothetical protein
MYGRWKRLDECRIIHHFGHETSHESDMLPLIQTFFMIKKAIKWLIIILIPVSLHVHGQDSTYAERLGFPKGARVLILHADDAG